MRLHPQSQLWFYAEEKFETNIVLLEAKWGLSGWKDFDYFGTNPYLFFLFNLENFRNSLTCAGLSLEIKFICEVRCPYSFILQSSWNKN